MRVVNVEVQPVVIPFVTPLEGGAGRRDEVCSAIVRLRTDEGVEGLGEMCPAGDLAPDLRCGMVEALEGLEMADGAAVEAALAMVEAIPGAGRAARAAVASALLDVAARAEGRPVAHALARSARSDVAVNGLIGAVAPDEAASQAAEIVGRGFGCLKLKGGSEPEDDLISRLAAVRDAVGPDVALRLDLNGSLEPASAVDVLGRLARFDLEYVEQPIAPEGGPDALARLRGRVDVPIAADESVTDIGAAGALLAAGAVDALVVKPSRVGGLREAMAIVEAASPYRVPVTISTLFESGVGIAGALHVAAATPGDHAHGLATAHLLASDLLERPLWIERGRMALPPGPGLGVSLDLSAIERFRAG